MTNETHIKICNTCGAQFECGSFDEGNACWCTRLPNIVEVRSKDCVCKSCLTTQINNQITQFIEKIEQGKGDKRDFTQYQSSELVEGLDFYLESGRYVFTKWYHLKRGYCCNSGCRHCPYGN